MDDSRLPGGRRPAVVGFASAEERLEMLFPPELLASGVTAGRAAERRASPTALTVGHVRHVAAVHVRTHVAPVNEPPIGLPASDQALVFAGGIADVASPVEEHRTRILRSV
jgi:hypothetical protein